MARTTQATLPFQTVMAVSETAVFIPTTGWMSAGPVGRLRLTRELRARTGTLEVTVGYQTCDVVNSPNAAAALGTYLSADGVAFPSQWADIATETDGAQWVRFGWMVRNASGGGTSLSAGAVAASLELERCGG